MRKQPIFLIIVAFLLMIIGVRITVALLVDSSNPVVNTFTVGGVSITLKETTGDKYIMAPGAAVAKDPKVTVLANSEKNWLFVKVEKQNEFDTFCTYDVHEAWTALDGQTGVYYRLVENSTADQVFPVLKNDQIFVKDTLTEEQLDAVTENPKLVFTAYAAQSDGLASAQAAWQILSEGKEE